MKLKKFPKIKINENIVKEIAIVTGFTSVIRGLWLIHPAAALIIGGITLLWFGFPGKEAKR